MTPQQQDARAGLVPRQPQDPTAVPPTWHPRSELEVVAKQLRAIDSFNRARHLREQAAAVTARTREMRLDASRSLQVLRRQHDALIARADQQLRASGAVLHTRAQRRVVLAHRNDWFLREVARVMNGADVAVLAQLDNGADVVGLVVAEQPDAVLVEDALAMGRADDVLRDTRTYSPTTLVTVHAADGDRSRSLVEAGAAAVFPRRTPPQEVAGRLLALLSA